MGVGAMWLWHAQTLCNAAVAERLVHRVQEARSSRWALAFWWPILAPRDGVAAIAPLAGVVYLFTACVACTILGMLVTFSPVEVCSVYRTRSTASASCRSLRDGWGLTPGEGPADRRPPHVGARVPRLRGHPGMLGGSTGPKHVPRPLGALGEGVMTEFTAQGLEQAEAGAHPALHVVAGGARARGDAPRVGDHHARRSCSGVGLALFVVSLAGWIGEIRHEQ
jgi:hypothetical protein